MHSTRKIKEDLIYVGGSDRRLSRFENLFPIPRGVSYNSYVLLDEKTVLLDTVDDSISRLFCENVTYALGGRALDYLVVQHMEPDHCAMIEEMLRRYPEAKLVCSAKALGMLQQFYGMDAKERALVVAEGDKLSTGRHTLHFIMAPMVHWPEVMMTYEITALLKKASALDIETICPLHGPVWQADLGLLLDKYQKWSTYEPEAKGVLIAYATMYSNTENAVNVLAGLLAERGVRNIAMYDVSETDVSELVAESFRLSHLVLAAPTYNGGLHPRMESYLADIKALNLQKRTVALLENGTWAPASARHMRTMIESMKEMTVLENTVAVKSALADGQRAALEALADEIAAQVKA